MSFNMQKLDFIVSLIDKVSGPAGKVMKTMDTVTTNIQQGYQKIGYGAAGAVGAGFAIDRLITPAKELNRAIGEVKSLDVANDAMQALTKTALQFSGQYGDSATDFVRASYDIQSAIGGLAGNELAKFTEASAILAKGTKADTATITDYVGTMYGIFQKNANAMGKAEWIQQLSGQTATAVQMFKTTGDRMSQAFTTLGANATSFGISMNEQMAVLGTLQASMSGAEAGTKYKSFLAGVGKAQKKLGLQFTDSQGKILPVLEILKKIEGKYGDLSVVAEGDLLGKAFGKQTATDFVKALIPQMDGLSQSIEKLGNVTGMEKAVQMANAIADPFEQGGAKLEAVQIKLANAMMPTIVSLIGGFGDFMDKIAEWQDKFPNITRIVGMAAIGIFGLIAAFSLLSIIMGVVSFAGAGFALVMGIITSPITLVVLGVGALVGLIAAAVMYWDEWTTAVVNWASPFMEAIGLFDFADGLVESWQALPDWFTGFAEFLLKLNPFSVIIDSVNWILDKVKLIPGLGGESDKATVATQKAGGGFFNTVSSWFGDDSPAPKPLASGPASQPSSGAGGGVINRISNATSNNTRSIGEVHMHNYGQRPNAQQFADDLAMVAP